MPAYTNTIDHIGLHVPSSILSSYAAFLAAALAPLSITEQFRPHPLVVAFGPDPSNTFLWISAIKDGSPDDEPVTPVHLALKARTRKEVDEFYSKAIEAGGQGNGEPGIRERYHAGYYAAFIKDPSGNNLEVVAHEDVESGRVIGYPG